jgi:hypothetical protein
MASPFIAVTRDRRTHHSGWDEARDWLLRRAGGAGGRIERRIPRWDDKRHLWQWQTVLLEKVQAA